MISVALGGDGGHGLMKREVRPKLVVVDGAGKSVADGEVMAPRGFGAAGDSDEMVVETAVEEGGAHEGGFGMARDSLYDTEPRSLVGRDVKDGTVEVSDSAIPQHEGGFGMARDSLYDTESRSLVGSDVKDGMVVQVQAAAGTVEVSDSAIPQHAKAESDEDDQRAGHLPRLDKHGFPVSDLVWSKLKDHSWWPGEIFDPSDASELALKHQKKGNYLVALFGGSTFAWCDESQLKPFMANYSHMEKQSNSGAFIIAVNHALEELSRRILWGTSCSCLSEQFPDNDMSYMVENSGLKDGVTCSRVNQAEILKYFSPASFLHYVKSLAQSPGQGGDLLDLVIACSHLTSFYRSKGYPELTSFQTGSTWVENDTDTLSAKNVMSGEAITNEVQPSHVKPKRGRGRPRKRKPDDNLESTEKKMASALNAAGTFQDAKTKTSTQTFPSQLTGPSSTVEPQNGPACHKKTSEAEYGVFDISSDDNVNEFSVKKWAKRRRVQRHRPADIAIFSDYKNCAVSASTEARIIGQVEGKRSGKQNYLPSPKVEATDHVQDAYWSGLSVHDDQIHTLRGPSYNTRLRQRRRSSRQIYVPSPDLFPNKKIQVIEKSIIHVDEKMVHEVKPTALVLSFGRVALPSEIDLVRMFSRYGPLKESETEVHKNTNTAQVVFKKRVDAERAFSAAGKYDYFGPSLRSFRLVSMPFSLSMTESNYLKLCPEDSGLEIPARRVPGVPPDSVQADIVEKADKGEAVKKPSVEQAEMVKQAGQREGTIERPLHAEGN